VRHSTNLHGFLVWLFCLCMVLFNWPILTISGYSGLVPLFLYLITCWSILTLVAFLFDRDDPEKDQDGSGGTP